MCCWGNEGGRKGKIVNHEELSAFPIGLKLFLKKNIDWY